MIKVALTGNYYSGQDQVAQIFKNLDVKVFDADLLLRYLINFSPEHIKRIKNNFGERSYTMGTLNTALFRSIDEIESLIDIVEFDILLAYAKFRLKNCENFYSLFKYSFLYERELELDFDYVINTSRPRYLRDRDLKDLTKIPTTSIYNILKGEIPEKVKNSNSNFVITNSDNRNLHDIPLKNSHLFDQVKKINDIMIKKIPQTTLGD